MTRDIIKSVHDAILISIMVPDTVSHMKGKFPEIMAFNTSDVINTYKNIAD